MRCADEADQPRCVALGDELPLPLEDRDGGGVQIEIGLGVERVDRGAQRAVIERSLRAEVARGGAQLRLLDAVEVQLALHVRALCGGGRGVALGAEAAAKKGDSVHACGQS